MTFQLRQRALFCLHCGATDIYARGHCLRCYARLRWDRQHFSGLREAVLSRDSHVCRICGSAEMLVVHHRNPGVSKLDRMVTLCAACHARIERTLCLRHTLPPLLCLLWREIHPMAPEQLSLVFPDSI
ncbi:MAG: HNH endonuclease [Acidobacteriaceae bacterium]